MTALDRLAGLAGIEESYWDIFGSFHETTAEAKLSILSAMGFDMGSEQAIAASLGEFEERPWRQPLDPVYVVRRGGGALTVTLTLPEALWQGAVGWRVELEDGTQVKGDFRPGAETFLKKRDIDGVQLARLLLRLPEDLAEGYHRLCIDGSEGPAEAVLIVAPSTGYAPEWLKQGNRLWGIACHLYSLRSTNDWGMGDFSCLAQLSRITAGLGGTAVGINPLHALFPVNPDHASPYSPSSRRFLNPLYIDVTQVLEFQDSVEVRALAASPGFAERLAKAKDDDYVDYPLVSAIKMVVLERMHDFFAGYKPEDPRRAEFQSFLEQGGTALRNFTLFQTLHKHFEGKPWSQWPTAYRRPDSSEAEDFAQENRGRLDFHAYLQWLAEGQLAAAAKACAEEGMAVGLYLDLAVGADPNGADAWSEPDAIVQGARFGAPPDAFNIQGQDWGIPPLHPDKLRDMAYRPFIDMLRANMRHAGALRIDHVMGLLHLYWIPPGEKACNGAYVRYPFDDLLGILALESVRNQCLVVGEDLGTVPDGFRDRMADEGALSYKVLRFERHAEGLFKRPDAYPPLSLTTSATHDLSTVIGHWLGRDVDLRRQLGLYDSSKAQDADKVSSAKERDLLIAALKDQGVLSPTFPDKGSGEEECARQLVVAVNRFLARSPSQLLKVNLDDLLLETDQLNLPGTVTEFPNWRRKSALPLESLSSDPFIAEVVQAIKSER